jgi:hypothetical protein
MDAPEHRTVDETLKLDAEKVARRTLRHKFGRLSNRRILATLRAADDAVEYANVSDDELLDRWFAEYEAALRRLRAASLVR